MVSFDDSIDYIFIALSIALSQATKLMISSTQCHFLALSSILNTHKASHHACKSKCFCNPQIAPRFSSSCCIESFCQDHELFFYHTCSRNHVPEVQRRFHICAFWNVPKVEPKSHHTFHETIQLCTDTSIRLTVLIHVAQSHSHEGTLLIPSTWTTNLSNKRYSSLLMFFSILSSHSDSFWRSQTADYAKADWQCSKLLGRIAPFRGWFSEFPWAKLSINLWLPCIDTRF